MDPESPLPKEYERNEHERFVASLEKAYKFLFGAGTGGTHKSYGSATVETAPITAIDLIEHNLAVYYPEEGEPTNEYGQVIVHLFHKEDGTVSVDLVASTRPKHFQGPKEAELPLIDRNYLQPWRMVDIDWQNYQPPMKVASNRGGMENEVGVGPGGVPFSAKLKRAMSALQAKLRANARITGKVVEEEPKITGEVVREEIEMNLAPTPARLPGIMRNFTLMFNSVLDLTRVGNGDSRIFVSSLNPYPEIGEFPDDKYVREFMGPFIARNLLNITPTVIEYLNRYGRETVLADYNRSRGRSKFSEVTMDDLAPNGDEVSLDLRMKIVKWFSAMAIHNHVEMQNQNPENAKKETRIYDDNSSVFIGNAITFGTAQFREPMSHTSFALNGYLLDVPGGKRRHREIFMTSLYQPPTQTTKKALANIANSIRSKTPSITRAKTGHTLDDQRWHGAFRPRGELGTIEILQHDALSSAELSSSLVMADSYDAFLLSHLYKEGNLDRYGISMDEVRNYYCIPAGWNPNAGETSVDFGDEELEGIKQRYETNRLAIQNYGTSAQYITPSGNRVNYADHLKGHEELMIRFYQNFNDIHQEAAVEIEEVAEVFKWLGKTTEQPSQANIENYHNPRHPDYMKGTMGYHLTEQCKDLISQVIDYGNCHYEFADGTHVQFTPDDLGQFIADHERGYYPDLISWYMDNIVGPVQRGYIREKAKEYS